MNNAQMVLTGQYDGSERWQGTVIIENGYLYGKCRPPVVFSMEWTGAPLPTAGSGVPGVTLDPSMADFLHIDSPEGILLVVDEYVMPTLTM